METSYLKAQPFRNRYPERMPNPPSDRGLDSNPCIWGSLSPQNTRGSSVLWWPLKFCMLLVIQSGNITLVNTLWFAELVYDLFCEEYL